MVIELENDPEMKRIQARRARDQERVKKLHNARLRNIGADIVGIQNQIQMKQDQKRREKEQEIQHANQQEEIRRYLNHIEQEQELKRRRESEQLRRDWQDQSLRRPERREADLAIPTVANPPIDADACGPGAVQKFDGEDPLKRERERLQALQLRDWVTAQKAEKEQRKKDEIAQDLSYAATVSNIVEFQTLQETEIANEKAHREMVLKNDNKRLAFEKQMRKSQELQLEKQAESYEVAQTANSALLTEDPNQAQSTLPGRVRRDHWKGMAKEQVTKIALSNSELIQEKQSRVEKEKEKDAEYAKQQELYKRYMEEAEFANDRRQNQLNQLTTETLAQQVEQAKEREENQKRMSHGEIKSGFFDGFGTSYR